MELNHILISPVSTEKSTAAQARRVYTFMVHPKANKIQVTQAVETLYGVTVDHVNVISVQKKFRTSGRRTITKRPLGRKALVTLAPKQTLDFNKMKLK